MKRVLQRVLWVMVPCLLLLMVEGAARHWFAGRSTWYVQAEAAAETGGIDVLFVGRSRVAAAVDPEVFGTAVARHLGRRVTVVNLGQGHTTLVQHYLALRNLLAAYPGCLRGGYVLLELAGGLPDESPAQGSWRGQWVHKGAPWSKMLLVPHLRWKDLPRLWRSDMERLDTKIELTLRFLGSGSVAVAHSEVFRFGTLGRLKGMFRQRAEAYFPVRKAPAEADLTQAGGIRTDEEGMALVRAQALRQLEVLARRQTPWRGWEQSIYGEIIRLVERHGGQVAFFEVPAHSFWLMPRQTELRRQDRAAFAEQAEAWGAPLLDVGFLREDSDFPDLVHLSASRARIYSDSLARTFANTVEEPEVVLTKTQAPLEQAVVR